MSIGRQFLAAVIAEADVAGFLRHREIDHLFKGEGEVAAFKFVKNHAVLYGALPKADTVLSETGEILGTADEPSGYYLSRLESRWKETTVRLLIKGAQDALAMGGDEGIVKATEVVTETAMTLLQRRFARQLVDFRDAGEPIFAEFLAQWKPGGKPGLFLGWPTLDEMTHGLGIGDTVAYVGRPGIGKTWQMLYGALHGWRAAEEDDQNERGSSRLFISMEMDLLPIQQRLMAMFTGLKIGDLKKADLDDDDKAHLKNSFVELKGKKAPFWIVSGNLSANVSDIELLCRYLKPDAVFIDGAYLLKHPTEHDRYKRVAENADLLKQRIAAEFCPVVCSWQFKRAENKKKAAATEEVTLDDIAYADAIGQVSSLVLGLFEADNIEAVKQRKVRVLKGRSGETGEFYAKWDFEKMDFSEVVNVEIEDLNFV